MNFQLLEYYNNEVYYTYLPKYDDDNFFIRIQFFASNIISLINKKIIFLFFSVIQSHVVYLNTVLYDLLIRKKSLKCP